MVWMRQSSPQAGWSHQFLPIAVTCSGGSCWKTDGISPNTLRDKTHGAGGAEGPSGCQWTFPLCRKSVAAITILKRSLRLLNPVISLQSSQGWLLRATHTQKWAVFNTSGQFLAFAAGARPWQEGWAGLGWACGSFGSLLHQHRNASAGCVPSALPGTGLAQPPKHQPHMQRAFLVFGDVLTSVFCL